MFRLKTLTILGSKAELSTLREGKLLINTINAHPNNIAFGKAFTHPSREVFSLVTGMVLEVSWTVGSTYLTSIHNFSAIIRKKQLALLKF